jgi:uncharacterized protein
MGSYWKYFLPATILTLVVVALVFLLGGPQAAAVTAILGVLELSLSVDNAVVNAIKLKTMDQKAQKIFLYFGIFIAVFGMRLLIPAFIVSVIGHLSFLSTFTLAVHNPQQYGEILQQAHPILAAFGGSFLFMIFGNFFIDDNKSVHWLPPLEIPLSKLAIVEGIKTILAIVLIAGFDYWLTRSWTSPQAIHFFLAGLAGVASYVLVEYLGKFVEKFEEPAEAGTANLSIKKKSSLGSVSLKMALPALLYLEVLDASMSFDGVMGAFALSSNILIIMAGLGIGAFWVRSLTLVAVEKGTLAEFCYLENGAFWAIGVLSIMLFISTKVDLPDWFVGLISAGIIGASVLSSIRAKSNQPATA